MAKLEKMSGGRISQSQLLGKRKNPEAAAEDDENIVAKVMEEEFVPLEYKKKKSKVINEEVPIEKRREDDLPMSLK